MEDRLREERERFSFALEAAGMVAWEWDPSSDRVVRSRNAERLVGLPAVGTGAELFALVHPEDRERVRQALDLALAEGEAYEEEFRIVRADGSIRWVADRGRVTRRGEGKTVCLSGVLRDITAERKIEEELCTSEERLHAALATLPVTSLDPFGIYSAIRDASGEIVDFRVEYVNDAASRANGMAREEQVGRSVLEILPAHLESGLFEHLLPGDRDRRAVRDRRVPLPVGRSADPPLVRHPGHEARGRLCRGLAGRDLAPGGGGGPAP